MIQGVLRLEEVEQWVVALPSCQSIHEVLAVSRHELRCELDGVQLLLSEPFRDSYLR